MSARLSAVAVEIQTAQILRAQTFNPQPSTKPSTKPSTLKERKWASTT